MAKRIAAALCTLCWVFFGYVGYVGFYLEGRRGVPGSGRWEFWIAVPTAMALLGVALVVVSKKAPILSEVVLGIQIVAILSWMFMAGGGI